MSTSARSLRLLELAVRGRATRELEARASVRGQYCGPDERQALEVAAASLRAHASGVWMLAERLDHRFLGALELIAAAPGRVVATGVGKSGLVARSIAATLSSTGRSAFFLHASDGAHGDLGAVAPGDVVLAVSHSGRTAEVLRLLERFAALEVPVVAVTGAPSSPLGDQAHLVLDTGGSELEHPGQGLVTTGTSALALALGHALAVALMQRRGVEATEVRAIHPAGETGFQLGRVGDVMEPGSMVSPEASRDACVEALDTGGFGLAWVVEPGGRYVGRLTCGKLFAAGADPATSARSLASVDGPWLDANATLADARRAFEAAPGHAAVPVLDRSGRFLGVVAARVLRTGNR